MIYFASMEMPPRSSEYSYGMLLFLQSLPGADLLAFVELPFDHPFAVKFWDFHVSAKCRCRKSLEMVLATGQTSPGIAVPSNQDR